MASSWEDRMQRQYARLEQANTTDWNKRTIRWFIEHYKPISWNRKDKYLRYLKEMAILVGTSFNDMTRDDVGSLLQKLESRFPEEWTFVDCKTMFKTFFKFYMDDIADRPEKAAEYVRLIPVFKAVSKIETSFRRHKQKKLVILTKDEVAKMLRAASNTARELAIVTFLYHTATRPSEFINMTVSDMEVNDDGTIYFTVAGKTGTRKLPLEADETAAQVLLEWLNQHPFGNRKDSPLWLDSRAHPLTIPALSVMLRRLSKRAGVRRICPKLFRKAKLSHMADDGYNAYQIKKYAGHTQLETAMFYIELSQKGFEDAIKKRYGRDVQKQAVLQPKKCWKCGYVNKPFHTRCQECGIVLDMQEAVNEMKGRAEVLASVLPPEMLEQLAKLVADKLKDNASTSAG